MGCKIDFSKLACGVAAGAIALAPLSAKAQTATDGTMQGGMSGGTTGSMSGGMSGGSMSTMPSGTMPMGTTGADTNMGMMSSPMQLTGTVVRYYSDRSGFVTAMDLQTTDGIKMVRFAPGMAQRLMTTYPEGATDASVYVMPTTMGSMTRLDAVGAGMTPPSSMAMSYMTSDLELLEAEPYIQTGAKMKTIKGSLKDVITNDMGDVIALVLNGGDKGNMLVRVSRQLSQDATGYAGDERVTPLFKGVKVEATGFEEAPRYGATSKFMSRLLARAIVVNGRTVGVLGLPRQSEAETKSLLKVNLFGTKSDEEKTAMGMGYSTYNPNMGAGSMNGGMSGSMDTTAGSGSMQGGTMSDGTTGTMSGGMSGGTMQGGSMGGSMSGGTTGGTMQGGTMGGGQ